MAWILSPGNGHTCVISKSTNGQTTSASIHLWFHINFAFLNRAELKSRPFSDSLPRHPAQEKRLSISLPFQNKIGYYIHRSLSSPFFCFPIMDTNSWFPPIAHVNRHTVLLLFCTSDRTTSHATVTIVLLLGWFTQLLGGLNNLLKKTCALENQ